MAQSNKADSEDSTISTPLAVVAPVFQEPSNLPRPERKLTKEERDYLNTRLPEYHALQSTLAARADGPRGVKNVKGKKKDWIRAHIFEDFKKKFNSAAPGGPALDSLFKVRSLQVYVFIKICNTVATTTRKSVSGSITIATKLSGLAKFQPRSAFRTRRLLSNVHAPRLPRISLLTRTRPKSLTLCPKSVHTSKMALRLLPRRTCQNTIASRKIYSSPFPKVNALSTERKHLTTMIPCKASRHPPTSSSPCFVPDLSHLLN